MLLPSPHPPSTRRLKRNQPSIQTISSDSSPVESEASLPSPPPIGKSTITKRRAVKEPSLNSPPLTVNPLPVSMHTVPDDFFRGHNFELHFKSSICHKIFVYKKSIDKFHYQNSPLHRLLESCGLSSLSTPPSVAYPKLVQQFYTNLENNGDCYTSFVKRKSLFFTPMDLGSILSIPYTGDCPFTLKGPISTPLSPLVQLRIILDDPTVSSVTLPKTTEVSPLAVVLHKVLRYNLLPHLGGGAEFTYQDLVLVALIMTGQSFNFSLMMLKHMLHCVKHSKKCLPYSCFLTKLFTHFQIPLDDKGSIQLTDSINSTYLKGAHITLLKGKFIRVVPEILKPIPPTFLPSSFTPLQKIKLNSLLMSKIFNFVSLSLKKENCPSVILIFRVCFAMWKMSLLTFRPVLSCTLGQWLKPYNGK